ncbi:non-ribosomal peptide synthetase [Rhodococcus globerulus]|uniref:Amino acid adenylation domain-containing protein n=1 Tax=Rhodococcus globerulus TaxID=33008 RepID=A0ABU4BVE3_RHOGO|nr:amino acid adenylation domain-containing protein [Rhodococcus globerulus]MDV6268016.1 amino acid adenylation domain-containing protein [Rhodococcus globerulus]
MNHIQRHLHSRLPDEHLPDDSVVRQIARVVESAPRSVAVVSVEEELDYGQLHSRASVLAEDLKSAGVVPGDLVALCVPRSTDCVVGALGILSAGAGYVALDPRQPDARLRFAVQDSSARALVAFPDVAARLDRVDPIEPPRTVGAPVDGEAVIAETFSTRPTDAAYVVYTSGSTGEPKGVVAEHGGLLNLIDWHQRSFELTSNDRCTLIASPGFDAAVWELWPALTAGASLHVVPSGLENDPVRLRDWLVSERVSVCFVPTPLAESLIAMTWPENTALRILLTGGDVLYHRPPPGLPFTLVNNYGLSEASVVSVSGVVDPLAGDTPADALPALGRAIDGVDLEVVGEDGSPVRAGEVGELVIRGVSVARGYLGLPDLTAQKFSQHGDDPAQREYRTGDLVRVNRFGDVEFSSRRDDQVQIRGNRVEVGEIAGVLDRHPAVQASVVIVRGDRQNPSLAAFVVRDDKTADISGLQTYLSAHLPDHMLPRSIIELDEFPTTAHGKIDRAALERAAHSTISVDRGSLIAPRNEVEAALAEIVAIRLDLPAVGIDENFFVLGGHSMLGAQLIIRIAEMYGVEMTLLELFDNPTVRDMAAKVEQLVVEQISGMSDQELLDAGRSE